MKKTISTKKGSTIFLRVAVSIIGLGVLALCVFLLPYILLHAHDEYSRGGYALQAIAFAMYISAIPFYIGVYKGWRILDAIDKGQAFSLHSVTALKAIAYCAGAISFIYTLCLPFFYIWADNADAPGLVVIALFLAGMPLIISVAMGLLQRLVTEAVAIKSENDLTV